MSVAIAFASAKMLHVSLHHVLTGTALPPVCASPAGGRTRSERSAGTARLDGDGDRGVARRRSCSDHQILTDVGTSGTPCTCPTRGIGVPGGRPKG
jgi:hypothetical protein